jgi:hypothetical protein
LTRFTATGGCSGELRAIKLDKEISLSKEEEPKTIHRLYRSTTQLNLQAYIGLHPHQLMALCNTIEPLTEDHSQFRPMVSSQNMCVGEGLYSEAVKVPETLLLYVTYKGVAKQGL